VLDDFDLDPAVVHLNHGSFGSVPRAVSAAQAAIRLQAEANPMRFFRVDSPGLKERARHVAAEFLGVGADEVAMVRNVTQATAVVLSGLAVRRRLGPGDVVVVGEQGYESVRRTVAHWCERTGAAYVVVPHPVHAADADLVDGFRRALTAVDGRGERTVLVIVDQITSPTGTVLPVEQVCALARSLGALAFVDAAHVPGQLPAHPERTGADFWTGTWHKWGFAPRGTSALWVTESERDTTEPLVTSWNHGQSFPWPFDTYGTDDYSGWFALGAAVDLWREAGGPAIAERSVELLDKGAAVVASVLPEVEAESPRTPAPCLRLVCLPDGVATTLEDADALYERLSALGVETQVTPYGGRGWIRLSGAVYNVPSDYERLADVLPAALPSR
jgi:isopenicillin-N epimerase